MEKTLASYKVTLIRLTKVRIKNLKMALNKIKVKIILKKHPTTTNSTLSKIATKQCLKTTKFKQKKIRTKRSNKLILKPI